MQNSLKCEGNSNNKTQQCGGFYMKGGQSKSGGNVVLMFTHVLIYQINNKRLKEKYVKFSL